MKVKVCPAVNLEKLQYYFSLRFSDNSKKLFYIKKRREFITSHTMYIKKIVFTGIFLKSSSDRIFNTSPPPCIFMNESCAFMTLESTCNSFGRNHSLCRFDNTVLYKQEKILPLILRQPKFFQCDKNAYAPQCHPCLFLKGFNAAHIALWLLILLVLSNFWVYPLDFPALSITLHL